MAEVVRPPAKIVPGFIFMLVGFLIGLGIAYYYTH